VAKLRERGGRMTPQRLAILQALLEQEHPTVDEIYRQVSETFPTTSVATVYRTVTTLKEMGEALEIQGTDPVAHYDAHRPGPHSHLVCVSCGRVMDSPEVDMAALSSELGRKARDWRLVEQAQFFGVCPECRARGAAPGETDAE
jgi:Fur family peroxide stress response transcriptional regulator